MSCSVHDTRPSTLDLLNTRPDTGTAAAAALALAPTITTEPSPSSETWLQAPADTVDPAVMTEASQPLRRCSFTEQRPGPL